jgi:large subunit ribosomal protein L17
MHRHGYSGRKFGRKTGPRKALLRGLAASVILYEKVKTTTPKAKEVRSIVDGLITLAKKGDLASQRRIYAYLQDDNAAAKLITEVSVASKDRNGGYTRIVKAGFRAGDAAPISIISLTDIDKMAKVVEKSEKKAVPAKTETTKTKAPAKKPAAKKTVKASK